MHCYVMWAVHIYTILFDVVSLNEKCSCLKCVLPLLFKGHLAICLVAKYKYFEQAIQISKIYIHFIQWFMNSTLHCLKVTGELCFCILENKPWCYIVCIAIIWNKNKSVISHLSCWIKISAKYLNAHLKLILKCSVSFIVCATNMNINIKWSGSISNNFCSVKCSIPQRTLNCFNKNIKQDNFLIKYILIFKGIINVYLLIYVSV